MQSLARFSEVLDMNSYFLDQIFYQCASLQGRVSGILEWLKALRIHLGLGSLANFERLDKEADRVVERRRILKRLKVLFFSAFVYLLFRLSRSR
jgi:hypothetical protein